MADADKKFKVLIETEADTSGIEKEKQGLTELEQRMEFLRTRQARTAAIADAALEKARSAAASGERPPPLPTSTVGLPGLAVATTAALTAASFAARQVFEAVRESSEQIAKITKEVGDQVILLDKASEKWSENARNAKEEADVAKVAGEVLPVLDAITTKTREIGAEQISTRQRVIELLLALNSPLTTAILGAWTPFTDGLRQAQAEQRKLQESAQETAVEEIQAAQRSKAAWEAFALEHTTQAFDELTKKLQAFRALQANIDLSPAPDLQGRIAEFEFLNKRAAELAGQFRALSAIDRERQEFQKALAGTLDVQKTKAQEIAGEMQRIDSLLQALGVTARTPAEAFAAGERTVGALGAEIRKLATELAKLEGQAKEAADKATAGASSQVKAVLANEQAAAQARKEGRDKDADQFEKSARDFEKGASPQQKAELENIRKLKRQQSGEAEPGGPLPGGPVAGPGESQEKLNEIERNRRAAAAQPVEQGTGGPSLIGPEAEAARKKSLQDTGSKGATGAGAELRRNQSIDKTREDSEQAQRDREESNARQRGDNRAGEIERETQDQKSQPRPPQQQQSSGGSELVSAVREQTGLLRQLLQKW